MFFRPSERVRGGDRYPHPARIRGMWTGSIACAGTVIGLVLAGKVASPSVLSALSTAQLLGVLLLVAGPALTVLALRLDQRIASTMAQQDSQPDTQVRTAAHDAQPRTLRAHTRVSEAHTEKPAQEHAA